MKKLPVLLAVTVLLSLFAVPAHAVFDGEIQFRNIPWEYSLPYFGGAFQQEIGIDNEKLHLQYEDHFSGVSYTDVITESIKILDGQDVPFYSMMFNTTDLLDVAGYPVRYVSILAIPQKPVEDVNTDWHQSTVYSAKYAFSLEKGKEDEAYEALKAKLTAVYGERDYQAEIDFGEMIKDLKGITIYHDVWIGLNNTSVILWHEGEKSSSKSVSVIYQRTDVDRLIAAYKAAAAGDTSGL